MDKSILSEIEEVSILTGLSEKRINELGGLTTKENILKELREAAKLHEGIFLDFEDDEIASAHIKFIDSFFNRNRRSYNIYWNIIEINPKNSSMKPFNVAYEYGMHYDEGFIKDFDEFFEVQFQEVMTKKWKSIR